MPRKYEGDKRDRQKQARAAYHAVPENAEKAREYRRQYVSRPEVKRRLKEQQAGRDAALTSQQREERKAKQRAYTAAYNAREDVKARDRQRNIARAADPDWVAQNKHKTRVNYLRRAYGMSLADRGAMLVAQGGRCALCDKAIRFAGRSHSDGAAIDHCHETGRVRGILCSSCNTSLGKLGDTVESIRKVLAYLERSTLTASAAE